MLLKSLKVTSDQAINGEDCLLKIQDKKNKNCPCGAKGYELIFMDLNMPILDGYGAVKKINEGVAKCNIPSVIVIAATAFVHGAEKQKVIDAGMDDYISKPIDIALVEEKLRKYRILI